MSDLAPLLKAMRLVQADADADAARIDGSLLDGRTVGSNFGALLAMVDAVAKGVEALAVELQSLERTLNSRTEHLV